MAMIQKNRPIGITTPLGEDVLLLVRVNGWEELGRLSHYELEMVSEKGDVDATQILGKPVSIRLELPGDKQRYFHGHVVAFRLAGVDGRLSRYEATVRPSLWFLTLAANCRIFNNKSAVEVIKAVFADYPAIDVKDSLSGSYDPIDYTVQYRESDFDFVSRLMEREGIYYYFKHEKEKHTLVLSDAIGAHAKIDGDPLPYRPRDTGQVHEYEHVSSWQVSHRIQPGIFTVNDFDFQKFGATSQGSLKARSDMTQSHSEGGHEIYDYPGSHLTADGGTSRSRTRIEALHAQRNTIQGSANARLLAVGSLFSLAEHQNDAQNAEYLLVSASYTLNSVGFETKGQDDTAPIFACDFDAIPQSQAFRALPTTPRAVVRGLQTATVVGPSGEEIYTDKYGRVKVQFHWDLKGQRDENTTCWMRVSQNWAGKRWGAMFLPRIGQEVIVDFLEGDPDQPIITGRVYNSDNMPPYTLPDEMTKSTIKSNSSKGGDGYNELRFEDKKGSEQVYLHAEKDQDNYVKNDSKEWIGKDRSLIVKGNQMETVEGDKSLTVKGDHKETVSGDQSLHVLGKQAIRVNGNHSLEASQKIQVKSGTDYAVDSGTQIHLKAGMDLVIEAGMSITLKAGGGFIVIGPAGVDISGTPINLNSGGSAGSGNGSSPEGPADPADPVEADAGDS
jgi:type VI secretion system secreted protein VgrG